jgi:plastocyanin
MGLKGFKALAVIVAASAALFGSTSRSGQQAAAQTMPGQPAPQHWEIQVDNLSPAGHSWGFNAYYPDHLQAHAGDDLTFRVAGNANAFHTMALLPPAFTPVQGYPGYVFKDDDDMPVSLQTAYFNSKPFFGAQPSTLCGRGGDTPCVYDGSGALKSGVLVNPPAAGGGAGNPSFSLRLDEKLTPGTYFFLCLVHGPSMSGSIDVLPSGEAAQPADVLLADAGRQYSADLLTLAELERSAGIPSFAGNPDGSRTWGIMAGAGAPNDRLTVDQFGVRDLVIRPGDTVTWTNSSPAIVAHTVTGLGQAGAPTSALFDPFQPVCGGPDPDQNGETDVDTLLPPGTGFAPDIWNDCPPWQQEDHLTPYALPSLPSGSSAPGDAITSGLLLPAAFLTGDTGRGLPFASTYSVVFPAAGTYSYRCMLHSGMTGRIEVVPTPTPSG